MKITCIRFPKCLLGGDSGSFNHEIITSNFRLSTLRNFHYRMRSENATIYILKRSRASESPPRLRNNTEEVCAEKADIFHEIIGTRVARQRVGIPARFVRCCKFRSTPGSTNVVLLTTTTTNGNERKGKTASRHWRTSSSVARRMNNLLISR